MLEVVALGATRMPASPGGGCGCVVSIRLWFAATRRVARAECSAGIGRNFRRFPCCNIMFSDRQVHVVAPEVAAVAVK